jgi:hypothetical protein
VSLRPAAFGEWDAPVTDGAEWIDVPTHETCMHCRLSFEAGDNGAIMPTGYAQHRECALRSVLGGIGHLVDHDRYCHGEAGPDAGLSYRASALLAWRHCVEGWPVSLEELEAVRNT